MDIITIEEFKNLIDKPSGWCVSLYMPTHRQGPETEQDPIRYKNLLRQIEDRLKNKGLRTPDVQEMLKPAQRLVQDPAFWRHQSDGLAVFITAETFQTFRLPLPFSELVVVSDRFHLKPLLPLFTGDGHFYMLALSQNEIRLLEGTRYTVDEVAAENLPKSMADALQYEHFSQELQFHTSSAGGGERRPAMFHGHDARDEDKKRILRWFHKLDAELSALLTGERSPLVLAGVDYLLPLYQEANTYAHLLAEGVTGNPEERRPQELHERAWPLVQPVFTQAREKALARYSQSIPNGQGSDDLSEVILAAHHGRVDVLFVALGVQIWGTYDPATQAVDVHEGHESGDEDLLDLAAMQTIMQGGTVYAVAPEQMPTAAPVAAVFRY